MTTEPLYLVWSNEHGCWWRPNSCGYTTDRAQAGRYTKAEADDICRHARSHTEGEPPPEVAYPEEDVISAEERDARDARRYRAIRNAPSKALKEALMTHYGSFAPGEELDAAVDQAIQTHKTQ